MNQDPHLIIIRGNSATGKTTIAEALHQAMGTNVANIGQDHIRRVVLQEHDVPGADNITLIDHMARKCLELGRHTILEGIFYESHYGEVLRDLLADHGGPSHAFYLDLPLAGTLLRHQQRSLSREVPIESLQRWYRRLDLLGVESERVLDARKPVERITQEITDCIGLEGHKPHRA